MKVYASSVEGPQGDEGPQGPQGEAGEDSTVPGADGYALTTEIHVSQGNVFRNNIGIDKVLKAVSYLNGELITDTLSLKYRWYSEDSVLYLDGQNNLVSLFPAVGLSPADPDVDFGTNTQIIVVDPSDIVDGGNLQILCRVTQI